MFFGILLAVWLLGEVAVVAPAHLILTRVQASLLRDEDGETLIMPRARALKNGPVGIKEAWRTVSWANWRRFALMYVWIFVLVVFAGSGVLALTLLVFIFLALILHV